MVSYQGGLSSGWSLIWVVSQNQGGLSLGLSLRVVSHQVSISSEWFLIRVVYHQGGPGWCLISVISHQCVSYQGGLLLGWCGLSSGWSLKIMVVSQGVFSSGLYLIRVVSHQGGFSSGRSLIRVVSHQSDLSGWLWKLRILPEANRTLDEVLRII